jgi:hypothetical protein
MDIAMMRFFTREWHDGELSDGEYENVISSYNAHFEEIRAQLPARLVELVGTISLNDAEVRSAIHEDHVLQIDLRAGDLQVGYCDLQLRYIEVLHLDGWPSLMEVFGQDSAEIVEDEIDASGSGEFEHRLLFSPNGEIFVRFRDFDFTLAPVAMREFTRETPVFRRH